MSILSRDRLRPEAAIPALTEQIHGLAEKVGGLVDIVRPMPGELAELRQSVGTLGRDLAQMRGGHDAVAARVDQVERLIERGKGAWWIASILWAGFGALVIGAVVSGVVYLFDMRDRLQAVERSMEIRVERPLGR